jgi:hypothetical protein
MAENKEGFFGGYRAIVFRGETYGFLGAFSLTGVLPGAVPDRAVNFGKTGTGDAGQPKGVLSRDPRNIPEMRVFAHNRPHGMLFHGCRKKRIPEMEVVLVTDLMGADDGFRTVIQKLPVVKKRREYKGGIPTKNI